jgi:hypothetical protein
MDQTKNGRFELAFRNFHNAHPEVYITLVELARYAKERGQDRWSIDALFQKIRWEQTIERGEDSFMLNDHYRSYYARKIMQECPDLEGFFEIRPLRALEPVLVF